VGKLSTRSAGGVVSFGSFQLLPAQHLLLEGEAPVRLGSRALAILTTLVERPGELVTKGELMARVWPDTFVDEAALRVHVSGLRRALGDGQTGRRFVANVPGRGYQFVAPVEISEPRTTPSHADLTGSRPHNLPFAQTRAVGRAGAIRALADLLPKQRFITVVGAGGIGKTTVALALAETLLPAYEDGIRIVDLAPVDGPQFVPSAFGVVLGLSIHPENAAAQLVDFLRDKRMLIVLDSCEHVINAAASLAEQLVAGAPGVHILATSREPLRAEGERVHRLQPLDVPADPSELTAAEALAYSAVQLFVERAAAILDGFELSDADAPIVSAICSKLGGIALAIELAAARVDAFGIQQLKLLLDDRFRILNQGRRTAQPRHQSLAATLDWSYEFLSEIERAVLRRLSIFAGVFTLEAAIAVAGDDDTDAVEPIANLVAKSLVSADVGGAVVHYRLLETTRVYALEKLKNAGDFHKYARRHAQHHLDWFKSLETNWQARTNAEWPVEYGQRIDDLRAALNWSFSPSGDIAIAVSLTAASSTLWLALAPAGESLQYIERALSHRTAVSTLTAREETRLLRILGGTLTRTKGPRPYIRNFLTEALEIAERMDDVNGRVQALLLLSVHCLWAGHYRESAALAERSCAAAGESSDVGHRLMGAGVAAFAFYCLGEFGDAQRHIDSFLNEDSSSRQYWFFGFRMGAQNAGSNLQWLRGFPDQAMRSVESSMQQAEANGVPIIRMDTLTLAACPIALCVGDFAAAERWIATLLDLSTRGAVPVWNARGQCLRGMLLTASGDKAGLPLLESALDWLREADFAYLRAIPTAALAQGLAEAGEMMRARSVIDETLEQASRSEENWCMPELLRIKGEILLSDGAATAAGKAEDYFLQALDRAHRLGALSWELRAAMSLAKLWRRDGKTVKAKELLSSVYDRFTEGFETVDLKAARGLIDRFRDELRRA
jgi:predicted ATPase/DNA-binding winged helix-turn-helix (wHTH) protein